MRVAFFNELDSYALVHGLNSRQIIERVGLGPAYRLTLQQSLFWLWRLLLPKTESSCWPNYSDHAAKSDQGDR